MNTATTKQQNRMSDPPAQPDRENSGKPPLPWSLYVRGIAGMILGAVVGVYGFFWIVKQGFYAILLPGLLAGVGCRLATPRRSMVLSILCVLVSLGFGVYTEWMFAPFSRDQSFFDFLGHLHHVRPISIILIALGAVFGFWVAERR